MELDLSVDGRVSSFSSSPGGFCELLLLLELNEEELDGDELDEEEFSFPFLVGIGLL